MKQYLITIALFIAAMAIYDIVISPMLEKAGLSTFENAEDPAEKL